MPEQTDTIGGRDKSRGGVGTEIALKGASRYKRGTRTQTFLHQVIECLEKLTCVMHL